MGKKIMIVDDDRQIRKLIRATLELEEELLEISEAENGNEALEKARTIKPQLMILDIMMPGMLGYDVCKILKNSPETKNIYILFLTARESDISQKTVEICGGDAFMAKPFAPQELRNKIKKALGLA